MVVSVFPCRLWRTSTCSSTVSSVWRAGVVLETTLRVHAEVQHGQHCGGRWAGRCRRRRVSTVLQGGSPRVNLCLRRVYVAVAYCACRAPCPFCGLLVWHTCAEDSVGKEIWRTSTAAYVKSAFTPTLRKRGPSHLVWPCTLHYITQVCCASAWGRFFTVRSLDRVLNSNVPCSVRTVYAS